MKITLKKLAEIASVDTSTVSRALRNDSKVKKKTKDKIQKIAKELGYYPNLAARSLVIGKSRTIWFIVPSLNHTIEQRPAQYSGIYFNKRHYDFMVLIHNNDPEIYARQIQRLTQGVADGAIIIPAPIEKCDTFKTRIGINSLIEQKYPLVFLDRYPKEVKAACVVTDNYQATFDMIKKAYINGSKAIIDLCNCFEGNNASDDRSKGINAACKKFNLKYISVKDVEEIITNIPKNIAIIASNQSIIYALLQKNKHLTKEHNLIIYCFDEWRGDPYPAKKVIIAQQNFEEMARIASDMVIKMIDGEEINNKIRVPILGFDNLNSYNR